MNGSCRSGITMNWLRSGRRGTGALAFSEEYRGEGSNGLSEGTESLVAKHRIDSPARDEQLIEEVCERENCKQALARVKANKGSSGVDRMTAQQLPEFLKRYWPAIRE